MIWKEPVTGPRAWRGAELARALATAKATGLPLEEVSRAHFPLDAMARRLGASGAARAEHNGDALRA